MKSRNTVSATKAGLSSSLGLSGSFAHPLLNNLYGLVNRIDPLQRINPSLGGKSYVHLRAWGRN